MPLHQISEPVMPKISWDTFTAAPHRMMFFAGAIQLILPILLWAIELTGRYTSLWRPFDLVLPTTFAHGFIMLYGVLIFFFFGFLMTVYPRWMNGTIIPRDSYVNTFLWMASGMAIFEVGLFVRLDLAIAGLAAYLFGWLLGFNALYNVYKTAPAKNKNYETWINAALIMGWSGAASFLAWMITDHIDLLFISLKGGLWLFLLPVVFAVVHRMLPFFSSSIIKNYVVVQPRWSLPAVMSLCLAHFTLEINALYQWLFLADIPLALIAFYHSYIWKLTRSFVDRLLAVLHIALLWLGIGMTLFSVQSLYVLINGELILGKAPLHAITIGFISSMLIAMASRVSLGHSGRPLILDNITWYLFLGISLTACLRISADIQALNTVYGFSINIITVVCWLTCMSLWVLRFAPFYLKTRLDGKQG